jgi:biopolymer transport protein ExbD
MKEKLTGVPYDSTNNELLLWVTATHNVTLGQPMNWLIKGDNSAKYPTFSKVIDAFKKNGEYKYNLITNAADVPVGSELYKLNQSGQMKKETE